MSIFAPDRCLLSIDRLSVQELVAEGIRCVLVDRDNTCVPREGRVPDAVTQWFAEVHAAGITIIMISNNFHGRQVEASATEFGCAAVHHAMKPLPLAVFRAIRMAKSTPKETVLVGDQIFTDVVAGNLAGVTTVLVRPQSHRDLWYTHILHVFERPILRNRSYEGETDPTRHTEVESC